MITRPNEYNVKTTPSFICDQYAGDNHFFSLFQAFRFPEVRQQPIRSSLLESLSRGFANEHPFQVLLGCGAYSLVLRRIRTWVGAEQLHFGPTGESDCWREASVTKKISLCLVLLAGQRSVKCVSFIPGPHAWSYTEIGNFRQLRP
jgi:hypothetical protein